MVAKLVNQQNKRALPIVFGAAAGVVVVFVLFGLFDRAVSALPSRSACCSARWGR